MPAQAVRPGYERDVMTSSPRRGRKNMPARRDLDGPGDFRPLRGLSVQAHDKYRGLRPGLRSAAPCGCCFGDPRGAWRPFRRSAIVGSAVSAGLHAEAPYEVSRPQQSRTDCTSMPCRQLARAASGGACGRVNRPWAIPHRSYRPRGQITRSASGGAPGHVNRAWAVPHRCYQPRGQLAKPRSTDAPGRVIRAWATPSRWYRPRGQLAQSRRGSP